MNPAEVSGPAWENSEILQRLLSSVCEKRGDLWQDKSWLLHQDNAPAHNTLSLQQFLAEKKNAVLEQPPHSPNQAQCNFSFFPFPQAQEGHQGDLFSRRESHEEGHDDGAAKNPGRIHSVVHGGVPDQDGKVCLAQGYYFAGENL